MLIKKECISVFLKLTLYINTILFEPQKKKNIKRKLSTRKSKTKISKTNPSDRLISQKSLFKARFMKPLHTHGAPLPILVFSSTHVFFHTVSSHASTLRQKIKVTVYVLTAFFGGVFSGTTKFLAIQQEEKIDLGFSGCSGRTSCESANRKCSWYDWCFFNIIRFIKDNISYLKQHGN